VPDELRKSFHKDLAEIDGEVVQVLALLSDLVARDEVIDDLYVQGEPIERRATGGPVGDLTPPIRGLVEQLGRVGSRWGRMRPTPLSERDAKAGERLDDGDDGDNGDNERHVSLTAELVSRTLPVKVPPEIGGLSYERLGDHAVDIANRVIYPASGES
jgi:hypothetical protein